VGGTQTMISPTGATWEPSPDDRRNFPGCLVRLVRGLSPTTHVGFERAAEIYAFGTQ
jgi:hypothetical protein